MNRKLAYQIAEEVLRDHTPGLYNLYFSDGDETLVALCRQLPIEHKWAYKTMSEELLHCLVHGFCAEVLEEMQHPETGH